MNEVLTGTHRELRFEAVSLCEHCHGNGAEPGTPIRTCETCGGQGAVQRVSQTAFGQLVRTAACPTCEGEGKIPETPCEVCSGAGRLRRERKWDVEVPPGIESGQRIRISGAGHAGEHGAQAGDLYVEVLVADDERFERHGEHLVSVVPVPVTLAMLGGEVAVPTLEGEHTAEVPKGAQPGQRVVLRGKGLPRLRGRGRGDQQVVLDVVVPEKLSREQRRLVERLADSLNGGGKAGR